MCWGGTPDRFDRRDPTGAGGHRATRRARVYPFRQRSGIYRQGTPALAGGTESPIGGTTEAIVNRLGEAATARHFDVDF